MRLADGGSVCDIRGMPGSSRARAVVTALVLLVGYAGAVAWLTWPLASVATTFLAGTKGACRCDVPYSAWMMAWVSRALVDPGVHLADTNIYVPARGTFFYGPGALGALPYFAPVFLATGNATLATNVTWLAGLTLTAWSMHLVVQRWTGSLLAGVVAASVLLTNGWLTWVFVPTTPHMAALQLFPWILYGAAAWRGRLSRTLRLVPLVALQCLTDLVYVMPAIVAPLGTLALVRLCRRTTRADGWRLASVLGLVALVLAPVYWPYLRLRAENPNLAGQSVWAFAYLEAELPSQLWAPAVPAAVRPVLAVLLGAGALALARRRGRPGPDIAVWGHGLLWTLVGIYIALSPTVRVNGAEVTLPQTWASVGAAVYKIIRITHRLGVAALMGLGLLAGAAFAELAARIAPMDRAGWRAPAIRAALAATFVIALYRGSLEPGASAMGRPYLLMPAPAVPPALLAAVERIGGPLVELPTAVDDMAQQATAMYHSIVHRQPILNGYASYYPAGFPERMATVMRLPDADALATLVRETGLRLVWVNLARCQLGARRTWSALAADGGGSGLTLVARTDTDLLFAVASGGR